MNVNLKSHSNARRKERINTNVHCQCQEIVPSDFFHVQTTKFENIITPCHTHAKKDIQCSPSITSKSTINFSPY